MHLLSKRKFLEIFVFWSYTFVSAFGPKLDDEKEADPPEPFELKED